MELKSGEKVRLKTQIGCHFLKDIMFRDRRAYLIESCVIVPYFPNLYKIMKSDKEWGALIVNLKGSWLQTLPKLGDRKHWAPFT